MDVQPHLLNLSAYIDQNLDKDLPLSALAQRMGLSPFHFHRKFGAYFGESLHQHIKRLRLERAAFALAHGSLPVRQIARHSGYKTVSAFSHAFSGFAGESPTRYRTHGAAMVRPSVDDPVAMEPTWVGTLPRCSFAFLRSTGHGPDAARSVLRVLDVVLALVESHSAPGAAAARSSSDEAGERPWEGLDCIAATSDVYGVVHGADFRVDVGVDGSLVPPGLGSTLGLQTLPGGRYARYDLHARPGELVAQCRRASLTKLQQRGETPRLSQYFVRFAVRQPADDAARDFRLYIPLVG